ncbi:MAG: Membrane carboxypeptidase (penicillin-binding protein) [Phormidesmis priestleyi Ana]|uniref:Membrane carboxypeptidase (Penicillin-binding protein) n=1 Tax=Phormidesmis priestleyi Ana TaxID=1666911 RepID=A0A0P8BPU1_9CYAN|nr:MAG: Membrane carboxypeptidase (penicillin-binding protein) [Phormidesmis priestleyi Ana]
MTSPPPKPPKKTPNPNSQSPKTILGSITQAFQTVQANVDFAKIPLKANARVPKLVVETGDAGSHSEYPLVGEHYLLGRSSKSSDIVVRSPIVSQTHLSLTRDRSRPGNPFVLKDKGSTNGVYRNKKRIKLLPLRHGDVLTLGPQELADAVTVRYIDPPPWYMNAVRYGLYGASGFTGLLFFWIVALEWPKITINPLPESVQGPVLMTAEEDGARVPLNELPNIAHIEKERLREYSPYLPQAAVASEDSRFYWHIGVDPLGIVRALVTNIAGGEIREGASTLTQQMARNTYRDYVGTEDSAVRKIREAVVALKLETFYSKDQLMLLYLNRVYLGNNLYGFEDASQFYFGKSADALTISEAATLVGILPAPNAFNPVTDYEAAVEYRNRVITRMVSLGMISAEEGATARRSRIEISPKAREQLRSARAPYFYSYVYDELDELLGQSLAREGNFIVETSLNLNTQAKAEAALKSMVENQGGQYGFSEGALVTLNTTNGEIEALVGGYDYAQSQFNRATQALRQPGSTFKVFAFASALEQGISPGETFSCSDVNWDGVFVAGCRSGGGALDMYAGLARSENAIALRVAQAAGLDSIVALAERMGINSELNPVPGLVLGQSEVTPLEITGAFGAIANEGLWNRPHGIERIIDSSDCTDNNDISTCRVIYDFETSSDANVPVLDASVANTLVSMMQGVVQGGTGRNAYLGLGEGGKTGTTNDNVDSWFIGFVPRNTLVTGIWIGNDDNSVTDAGSAIAAQLWGQYMGQVVQ